jgi:hypothetical protein
VAGAEPDRLHAAVFYGVTLGQATVPERIAYAREPSKLPVVLSADKVVRFLEAIPSLKSRTIFHRRRNVGTEQLVDLLRIARPLASTVLPDAGSKHKPENDNAAKSLTWRRYLVAGRGFEPLTFRL